MAGWVKSIGSGPEPEVGAVIEAWLEARVEMGTPRETWAGDGKAVKGLSPAVELGLEKPTEVCVDMSSAGRGPVSVPLSHTGKSQSGGWWW